MIKVDHQINLLSLTETQAMLRYQNLASDERNGVGGIPGVTHRE